MKKSVYIFYMLLLLPVVGMSQDTISKSRSIIIQPPVPVEIFAGNRAISYQHVLSKNVFKNRFNFFNLAAFDAEYDAAPENEFVISSLLAYNIGKGFSIGVGGEIQPPGANFIAGLQYTYATDQFLLVLFPSFTLNKASQFAQFTLLEYRHRLNQRLRGYLRIQGLFSTNFTTYNRGQ